MSVEQLKAWSVLTARLQEAGWESALADDVLESGMDVSPEALKETEEGRSPLEFICERLIPSAWDQELLERSCPICKTNGVLRLCAVREPYNEEPSVHQLIHAVGALSDKAAVPMLWMWSPKTNLESRRLQFNHVDLEKPKQPDLLTGIPMTGAELRQILSLYQKEYFVITN